MQAYTHLVVGALCGRAATSRIQGKAGVFVGVVVAALTHPFLDILCQVTYHPVGGSSIRGPDWIAYHLVAYALAIAFAVRLRQHWIAMWAALWPDLDWVLRPLHLGWPEGAIHAFLFGLPGLRHLQSFVLTYLPDFRAHWVAGLPELAVSIVIAVVLVRGERRPEPALAFSPA